MVSPRIIFKFVQHHGWLELLRRIYIAATRWGFERKSMLIMKMPTEETSEIDPSIELKELTLSDLDQMLKVMYLSRADLYERFDCGERCFAVMDDGKIASYFWAQFDVRHLGELFLNFNLKPNQVWFCNAITVKSARGRGYYPNIIRYMAKTLKAEGFDEIFIDAEQRNQSSIRGIKKAGGIPVVKVKMKKMLSRIEYTITVFDRSTWLGLENAIVNLRSTQKIKELDQ